MNLLTPYQIACDVLMLAGAAWLWLAWWLERRTERRNSQRRHPAGKQRS